MIRALTLAIAAAALAPTAAAAATFAAKPTVSVTAKRLVAQDVLWTCGPAQCLGRSEGSRPAMLCRALVKKAGALDAFLVDGRAFTPAELAQCNGAARN